MISHSHRFVFTHVPKTAGKSIRSLFGLPEFESDYTDRSPSIEQAFGHHRLQDIKNEVYFSTYFKFSFVRNPFDRLVSAFFYLDSGGCNEGDARFKQQYLDVYQSNFLAFVEDLPNFAGLLHFIPQYKWLCDDSGELLTDFVGRSERVETDLAGLSARLGLASPQLPRLNASDHLPYQAYYDEAAKRRVVDVYGQDLELFRYRFGDG